MSSCDRTPARRMLLPAADGRVKHGTPDKAARVPNPLTTRGSLADDRGMVAVSQFDYAYTRRILELCTSPAPGRTT